MVNERLEKALRSELEDLRQAGTLKDFLPLTSPQDAVVQTRGADQLINLCSNNYLGLANHPEVIQAGIEGLTRYGAGTAAVRFICGTFLPHVHLERKLASFLGTESATTYSSCWNANEAVIPSLCDADTVVLSDVLNHASIIDAIRLARPAEKRVYAHSDMSELREGLRTCRAGTRKLIITDGVFSMEGDLARLPDIIDLARTYDAVVVVDDSHGIGVMGSTGRGVGEHFGLLGEIDVITGTLGKALGGGAGGFVASTQSVCEILAQRSRPQLFSNPVPPTVACSALRAVEVLQADASLVERLRDNTHYFRRRLEEVGFHPLEGESAIIPIIVGDTALAIELSQRLLDHGVFVTGFGYPVVPEGAARIRVQISAAHSREQLDRALDAFQALQTSPAPPRASGTQHVM